MAHKGRCLPLEPLFHLAWIRSGHPEQTKEADRRKTFTDEKFSAMIGFSSRTIVRWRANGGELPWAAADKAAIYLGEHPIRVWGEEWLDLDRDLIEGTAPKYQYAALEEAMEKVGKKLVEEESCGTGVAG